MRRSPTNSSACSSSSSSSSSSCIATSSDNNNNSIGDLPKSKRQKKNHNHHHHHHHLNPGQVIKACEINAASNAHNHRRSSIYRGVTRHRWTGRFEAHLWDKSSWNNIQNKKGRQVYLGAYDNEDAAARTYDLAALKHWGPTTTLNFPVEKYEKELEEMQRFSKEEYLASLRRQSSGFSRGVSKYRGVARHHHNGRWEARIGRVVGNKYLYLGTYNTQEEAAAAYDMAAIEYRGANAVTNFDISNYIDRLKNANILPNSDQPKEETNNNASEQEVVQQQQQLLREQEEDRELEVKHQHHDQPDQYPNLLDHHQIESPTLEQDVNVGTHELTWSFMDTGLITTLPLEELSVGNLHGDDHLPDLFGDIEFEDNIDLIFEAVDHDQGLGVLDVSTSCLDKLCGDHDDHHIAVGRMLPSSSPSSSSTTTTSVSSFCI